MSRGPRRACFDEQPIAYGCNVFLFTDERRDAAFEFGTGDFQRIAMHGQHADRPRRAPLLIGDLAFEVRVPTIVFQCQAIRVRIRVLHCHSDMFR